MYHLTKTLDQLMFSFYAKNDQLRITDPHQGKHQLRTVQAEDPTVVLRLLSGHRDDLMSERARALNRLHPADAGTDPRRSQEAALHPAGRRPAPAAASGCPRWAVHPKS